MDTLFNFVTNEELVSCLIINIFHEHHSLMKTKIDFKKRYCAKAFKSGRY